MKKNLMNRKKKTFSISKAQLDQRVRHGQLADDALSAITGGGIPSRTCGRSGVLGETA